MILTDSELLARFFCKEPSRRIQVSPIINWRKQLQPSSIDLRLGSEVVVFRREMESVLDLLDRKGEEVTRRLAHRMSVNPLQGFVIHPGDFLLATTFESMRLPADIAARLEGKSSWGRLGLQIHSTAGFIDPGFAGKVTFEISNVGTLPMRLYPGLLVAQVCFFQAKFPSIKAYDKENKYFGQLRTEPSRYYKDVEVRQFVKYIGMRRDRDEAE
jgi:dCTP deaminase